MDKVIGQCVNCGRKFTGSSREEVTGLWSRHNELMHKRNLRGENGCTLTFDQEKFK